MLGDPWEGRRWHPHIAPLARRLLEDERYAIECLGKMDQPLEHYVQRAARLRHVREALTHAWWLSVRITDRERNGALKISCDPVEDE